MKGTAGYRSFALLALFKKFGERCKPRVDFRLTVAFAPVQVAAAARAETGAVWRTKKDHIALEDERVAHSLVEVDRRIFYQQDVRICNVIWRRKLFAKRGVDVERVVSRDMLRTARTVKVDDCVTDGGNGNDTRFVEKLAMNPRRRFEGKLKIYLQICERCGIIEAENGSGIFKNINQ